MSRSLLLFLTPHSLCLSDLSLCPDLGRKKRRGKKPKRLCSGRSRRFWVTMSSRGWKRKGRGGELFKYDFLFSTFQILFIFTRRESSDIFCFPLWLFSWNTLKPLCYHLFCLYCPSFLPFPLLLQNPCLSFLSSADGVACVVYVERIVCGGPQNLTFWIWVLLHLSVRIEAGHPELQEHRPRDQQGGGSAYPDVEDDDADPNYARIQSFRDRDVGSPPQPPPQSPPYSAAQHSRARTPSPQGPFPGHGNHINGPAALPDDDPLDRLYAKVNKPRGAGAASPPAAATNDR